MPSIDTNLLLRIILNDIPAQRERTVALLMRHGVVAVSDLAIAETVFVLEKSQGVPRPHVAALLESLIANQYLNLNRPLFEKVLPHYLRHPKVSFNDCCLAVYAELNGQTPLYTFDRKLAKQIPHASLVG